MAAMMTLTAKCGCYNKFKNHIFFNKSGLVPLLLFVTSELPCFVEMIVGDSDSLEIIYKPCLK